MSLVRQVKKPRKNVLLLFGAWVLLFAAFWVVRSHGINPGWVFAALSAATFFVIVRRGYRRLFRSPEFWGFFVVWTLIHVAVYLAVLGYLGILYYAPIAFLELWVFYTIAVLRFGPPDKGAPEDRAPGTDQ